MVVYTIDVEDKPSLLAAGLHPYTSTLHSAGVFMGTFLAKKTLPISHWFEVVYFLVQICSRHEKIFQERPLGWLDTTENNTSAIY